MATGLTICCCSGDNLKKVASSPPPHNVTGRMKQFFELVSFCVPFLSVLIPTKMHSVTTIVVLTEGQKWDLLHSLSSALLLFYWQKQIDFLAAMELETEKQGRYPFLFTEEKGNCLLFSFHSVLDTVGCLQIHHKTSLRLVFYHLVKTSWFGQLIS